MLLSMEGYVPWDKLGDEKGLEVIKNAGFDAVDYSFYFKAEEALLGENYLELAQQTKQCLDRIGLICNQAHAPFTFTYGEAMDCSCPHFLHVVRSMEYAASLGAEHIVVHGIRVPAGPGTEASLEYNYQYYKALEPYAEKFGIKIAVENLKFSFSTPYMLNEMMKRLDSPTFIALIDVGHAQLFGGTAEDFISCVKPGYLHGLHIHDNYGEKDDHLIPGNGVLDWDKILQALAAYGYDGEFTLETIGFLKLLDADVLPEALTLSAKIGRNLMNKLEALRAKA